MDKIYPAQCKRKSIRTNFMRIKFMRHSVNGVSDVNPVNQTLIYSNTLITHHITNFQTVEVLFGPPGTVRRYQDNEVTSFTNASFKEAYQATFYTAIFSIAFFPFKTSSIPDVPLQKYALRSGWWFLSGFSTALK